MATLQNIRSKGPLLVIVIGLALFAFIAGDAWKVMQPHQAHDVGELQSLILRNILYSFFCFFSIFLFIFIPSFLTFIHLSITKYKIKIFLFKINNVMSEFSDKQ